MDKQEKLPEHSAREMELLQRIAVRENLLSEIVKLLKLNNDIFSIFSEITELIRAVRLQTVEIIEGIQVWIENQMSFKSFLYHGGNYLTKISNDLSFLDARKELKEYYGFDFSFNPLMHRGGNLLQEISKYFKSSHHAKHQRHNQELIRREFEAGNTSAQITTDLLADIGMLSLSSPAKKSTDDNGYIDGIPVKRIRAAERVVVNEFKRLKDERRRTKTKVVHSSGYGGGTLAKIEEGSANLGEEKKNLSLPSIKSRQDSSCRDSDEMNEHKERSLAASSSIDPIPSQTSVSKATPATTSISNSIGLREVIRERAIARKNKLRKEETASIVRYYYSSLDVR